MKLSKPNRVVFGIDDGIPSRIAASILRNQDFELVAVHLQIDLEKIGLKPEGYPSALRGTNPEKIEQTCHELGIRLQIVDVTEQTLAKVFDPFWVATLSGRLYPASAVWSRDILFPNLLRVAQTLGAGLLATGHFASRSLGVQRYSEKKYNQSRNLARLGNETIEKLLLPVGEVPLDMLLRLGREIGIIPKNEGLTDADESLRALDAERSARGKWAWTLEQLSNAKTQSRAPGEYFLPGPIRSIEQFSTADHRGIPFYQVGSPAPGHYGQFVREIQIQSRTLIIAPKKSLGITKCFLQEVMWDKTPSNPYRQKKVLIEKEPPGEQRLDHGPPIASGHLLEYPGALAELFLEEPLYGIAPGEMLVFYEEARIIGSAIIAEISAFAGEEKAIEKEA